jgi:hypothetical protein
VRILTVTTSFPKFEGDTTAPFIESITRELASRGHELTVVLPARSDLRPAPIEGVRFRPYRYAPSASLEVFGYAEALRADVALRGATYAVLPLAVLSGLRCSAELREQATTWCTPLGGPERGDGRARLGRERPPRREPAPTCFFRKSGAARARREEGVRSAARSPLSRDLSREASSRGPLGARGHPMESRGVFRPDRRRPRSAGELALPRRLRPLAAGRLVQKKGFEYLLEAAGALRRAGHRAGHRRQGRSRRGSGYAAASPVSLRLVGNIARGALPRYFAMADAVVVPR